MSKYNLAEHLLGFFTCAPMLALCNGMLLHTMPESLVAWLIWGLSWLFILNWGINLLALVREAQNRFNKLTESN